MLLPCSVTYCIARAGPTAKRGRGPVAGLVNPGTARRGHNRAKNINRHTLYARPHPQRLSGSLDLCTFLSLRALVLVLTSTVVSQHCAILKRAAAESP
ncbi:uncharacterized protein CC84DRAFT_67853 [Paraphaeosphaeria sporulosa]|uniref:Uncharacterized protein n=1 Tax=Paraphaeosphaeria sporulosa TaxID=1460663 RepID=A0A177CX70_9PLEO|nr:uncharacterized protein CC84DRAFT_67853 [Paraphaeosphaeria sporulosa]OAG12123.1 hypothetical protein CC84DRAFT_67853 [Paraphaeosphaeria sporulosa]